MNKLLLVTLSLAGWLWACALVGLWVGGLEASGVSLEMSAGAVLAALLVGLAVPRRFVGAVGRALRRLKPQLSLPALTDPTARDGLELSRVMGIAQLACAGGSLVSAALIVPGAALVRLMPEKLSLSWGEMLTLQSLVFWAVLLPWGITAGAAWHVHRLARQSGGPERDWRVHDDGLWALAIAFVLTGAGWRLGVQPLVLALAGGVVQLAAGQSLIHRPALGRLTIPSSVATDARASILNRLTVFGLASAVGLIGLGQWRILLDLAGLTLPWRMLSAGAGLGAVALFHGRWSKAGSGSAWPSQAAAGCAVTILACLALQGILSVVSLADHPRGRWLAGVVWAGQIPLAAGVAYLLVSQRRTLAARRVPARVYVHWLVLSLALAIGFGWAVIGWAGGAKGLVWLLLVGLAGSIVVGLLSASTVRNQVTWVLSGGVLMFSLTIGMISGFGEPFRHRGMAVAVGPWLTAVQQGGSVEYLPLSRKPMPCILDIRFGQAIAQAESAGPARQHVDLPSLLPANGWLVASRRPILPEADRWKVGWASADVGAADLPAWSKSQESSVLSVIRGAGRPYYAIFYAPIRADHPSSLALLNGRMLHALSARLIPDGLLVVHVPCQGDNAAPALAVARHVHELYPHAVLVARTSDDGVELLIVAWQDELTRPAGQTVQVVQDWFGPDVVVVPLEDLAIIWSRIPSESPFGRCGGTAVVQRRRLADYLTELKSK